MQPGREGALASEAAELVPESHEHILGAVLGIAGVAGETQAKRVNTAHVLAVQVPESSLVASLGSGDEIVRGVHGSKMPSGAAAFEQARTAHGKRITRVRVRSGCSR